MCLFVDFLERRGLPSFFGLLVYTCGNVVIFVGVVLFIKKVFISKSEKQKSAKSRGNIIASIFNLQYTPKDEQSQ